MNEKKPLDGHTPGDWETIGRGRLSPWNSSNSDSKESYMRAVVPKKKQGPSGKQRRYK